MKKTLYKPQTDDVNISVNVYGNESCNNDFNGCGCTHNNRYNGCGRHNAVEGCRRQINLAEGCGGTFNVAEGCGG
jgi:hypothetical protein